MKSTPQLELSRLEFNQFGKVLKGFLHVGQWVPRLCARQTSSVNYVLTQYSPRCPVISQANEREEKNTRSVRGQLIYNLSLYREGMCDGIYLVQERLQVPDR